MNNLVDLHCPDAADAYGRATCHEAADGARSLHGRHLLGRLRGRSNISGISHTIATDSLMNGVMRKGQWVILMYVCCKLNALGLFR